MTGNARPDHFAHAPQIRLVVEVVVVDPRLHVRICGHDGDVAPGLRLLHSDREHQVVLMCHLLKKSAKRDTLKGLESPERAAKHVEDALEPVAAAS
jgi:hypothetical protein